MPIVRRGEVRLHIEVDGVGKPIAVLAHGLTNSCRELAAFTPFVGGTKVRFCFRGHGHSSCPPAGYRFADFAGDLDAVARAYGAACAVGTSLGAGAILHLLERDPRRFERIVLLLPSTLDRPTEAPQRFLGIASALESMPKEAAIEHLLSEGAGAGDPIARDVARALWLDLNPVGAARAIRELVRDRPMSSRDALRAVEAPTLIIGREGDAIHPASVGRTLAGVMPRAELVLYRGEADMLADIPLLVPRVAAFLAGDSSAG